MGRGGAIFRTAGGFDFGRRRGAGGVDCTVTTSIGINIETGVSLLSAVRRAAKTSPATCSRSDANKGSVKEREVMGVCAPLSA